MSLAKLLFWIFLFIVAYSYIGYGLLLWLYIKLRSFSAKAAPVQIHDNFTPLISVVVPCFNEEDFIKQKIENTLSLDYPPDKLEIIFITDGSTDNTPGIVKEHAQVKLMHAAERKGKIAAMNRAMKTIKNPFVVFCDANTLLNAAALKEMVKHYTDEKVGGVTGEKKVINHQQNNTAGSGEGLYWKYESQLKRLDSAFYTVVGAAGELFSIRTSLFEELEEDVLLDDFMISMKICMKGYKVIYEPNAYATEKPSVNIKEEQKRKVRISAGAFQAIIRLKGLFNFFKHPKLSFQYISHRFLRWVICPFLLPLTFILNAVIVYAGASPLYTWLLVMQIAFYLMAVVGWLLTRVNLKSGLLKFPYYFLFMNYSLYLGFFQFVSGNQTVIWEKAKRSI